MASSSSLLLFIRQSLFLDSFIVIFPFVEGNLQSLSSSALCQLDSEYYSDSESGWMSLTFLFLFIKTVINMNFGLLFRSVFAKTITKRVVTLEKATINVGGQRGIEANTQSKFIDVSKIDWRSKDLAQLSKMNTEELAAITQQLNKAKLFNNNGTLQPPPNISQQARKSIMAKVQKPYSQLVELQPHLKKQPGKLSLLYELDLEDNQQIRNIISEFFSKLDKPSTLSSIVQPTFIKHLLNLNADLYRVGRQLQSKEVQIGSITPVDIQFEFWVGVHRNRARNKSPQLFIVEEKVIENPNNSILLKEDIHRKVFIRNIIAKRPCKDYRMGIMVQAELEVEINNTLHYVKVEFEGPRSIANNIVAPPTPLYKITDFDGIMRGNPTIAPVFKFY